jgi:hypothetical protein
VRDEGDDELYREDPGKDQVDRLEDLLLLAALPRDLNRTNFSILSLSLSHTHTHTHSKTTSSSLPSPGT